MDKKYLLLLSNKCNVKDYVTSSFFEMQDNDMLIKGIPSETNYLEIYNYRGEFSLDALKYVGITKSYSDIRNERQITRYYEVSFFDEDIDRKYLRLRVGKNININIDEYRREVKINELLDP